jgi:hypothetical protein
MKNFKQSTILLIGLLSLAATSCKKEMVTSSEEQGFISAAEKIKLTASESRLLTANAEGTSTSAAQVYKYRNIIDLSDPRWSEYNACTGELINITQGIWRINFMYIINKNTFTFIDHSNVSGYKLINLTTGVKYTGSYVSNTSFTGNVTGEYPIRITGAVKILLTTSGGGNNGFYMSDYHVTINANGEVTATFDNFRAGCQ